MLSFHNTLHVVWKMKIECVVFPVPRAGGGGGGDGNDRDEK